MNIEQAVSEIDSLPENTYICVREPWAAGSEVKLVPYFESFGIPQDIKDQGFKYFLEVDTVREILEPFLVVNPTPDQIFSFVLYYAEHDAFTGWSYKLLESRA